MKLVPERIVGNRNFANKIWNASRFVLMTTAEIGGGVPTIERLQPRTLADRWILSRLARLTGDVTRLIEDFQFGEAGRQINEFFWSDYCDWYLEIAKVQMQGDEQSAAHHGRHPARRARPESCACCIRSCPLSPKRSGSTFTAPASRDQERWPASALIVAPWPQVNSAAIDDEAEQHFSLLQEIITRIRDARNQMNVEPARRIPAIMAAGDYQTMLEAQAPLIEFLARTETPAVARAARTEARASYEPAGGFRRDLPATGRSARYRQRT